MNMQTDIEEAQYIDHIKLITTHWHKPIVIGKILEASAEAMSPEAGVMGDPFDLSLAQVR